jgi:hypothetical protein
MLMVLCPTSTDWIEQEYEPSGRQRLVLLDDFPDLFEVGMHILVCWFDQQLVLLSSFVLADILTEEIEAVPDVGETSFLSREFYPTLFHEGFDEGFDLLFKQLFCCCCYTEIVCVPYKVDFCCYPFDCCFWEAFPSSPF